MTDKLLPDAFISSTETNTPLAFTLDAGKRTLGALFVISEGEYSKLVTDLERKFDDLLATFKDLLPSEREDWLIESGWAMMDNDEIKVLSISLFGMDNYPSARTQKMIMDPLLEFCNRPFVKLDEKQAKNVHLLHLSSDPKRFKKSRLDILNDPPYLDSIASEWLLKKSVPEHTQTHTKTSASKVRL